MKKEDVKHGHRPNYSGTHYAPPYQPKGRPANAAERDALAKAEAKRARKAERYQRDEIRRMVNAHPAGGGQ